PANVRTDSTVLRVFEKSAAAAVNVPEDPIFFHRLVSAFGGASGKCFLILRKVKQEGEAQLFEIAAADGLLAFVLGFGKGGQEHARQNRDDGDDDEQFDQGEGRSAFHRLSFRIAQRRQDHISQDRDNLDYDQELDQRNASHSVADRLMVVFQKMYGRGPSCGQQLALTG